MMYHRKQWTQKSKNKRDLKQSILFTDLGGAYLNPTVKHTNFLLFPL